MAKTQEELMEMARTMSSNEIAFLVSAHAEHLQQSEFGWQIECHNGYVWTGICRYVPKGSIFARMTEANFQ